MDGCVTFPLARAHAVLLVLLLLAAAAVAPAPASKLQCHSGDRAALLAVKAAFGNASYFVSWTADIPCCHWFGVRCDATSSSSSAAAATGGRRVVGLAIMRDASVSGPVPGAAIARLTGLQELLFLHVPGVSGAIPPALARLSALTDLTISRTGVSGSVPAFLGELRALRSLDLSFNALTGAIPASLAALPRLASINLGRNRLTGAIPPLLLSKAGPEAFLTLSHNSLSGTVPAEFAAVSFVQVDLSRNALTGDASVLFGRGKPLLVAANLSRNALSFDMSRLELPERLASLDVSHNAIRGGVPAAAGNLSQLMFFNVSYNQLCGELPSGMASFEVYSFQHNKCLCGAPLPACQA
ncbi:polygalacturonase inhibitor-like [Panicum miliaceum]|uniref:Polygalacturonase inhibitor-like n=1 Tax=Panicum miliaceum TaxID=4540 RepID=A0A3L6T1G8_PANMI|nr:polygalacturonase inhibitor-like [Panicum miliaceum]